MTVKIRAFRSGGFEVDIRFTYPDGTPFVVQVKPHFIQAAATILQARFRDQATYLVPQKSPPGLTAVLVNGQQTVRDGRLTGTRAGAVL